jgi:prepilin-type processing-associated H-X9-DG protein
VAASDYSLLRWIQRHAGGHFAYLLGVVDDSTYKPPRYEGRPSFAVLGDAPIAGHQATEAVDVTKLRYSHGEGANLLFEDGSVRHVLPAQMAELADHPYINHRGAIEAGMNIDDAVLAPSWVGPFPRKRQR